MTYGTFNFPFNSCNTNEINLINSSDSNISNENLNYNLNTKETLAVNLCDDDLEIKLSNLEDCKYYSAEEFEKVNFEKRFNIFHNNVNGLETKFGQLHHFLASLTSELDVIAITETSHNDNDKFKSNIKIDNYKLFSTPTNTAKGGTAIFPTKSLILLNDLI